MDRDSIEVWCQRAGLGLLLAALAFAPLFFGAVRPVEWVVVQWLILGIAALWLARLWIKERFRLLLPPVTWAIVPFVAYAAWRWRTADIEFIARQEFLQIAFFALLFIAFINNLYGQSELRWIVFTLVVVATLLSMYGIYQWLTHSDHVLWFPKPEPSERRASATYICPNHFAGFVEMCLPLALALAVAGRFGPVVRIFLVYAFGVMAVGIAVSGSRGGWIATGVSLLVFAAAMARQRGYRWISLALAVALLGGGWFFYSKAIQSRVESAFVSGHGREIRLRLWSAAVKIWQKSPWVGVGPDHFDHRYREFRDAADRTQNRPGRAHNDYLNTLADYGVIGLGLLLLPLGVAAWGVVRSWPHLKRSTEEGQQGNRVALVLGSVCGLVAILIHSFFDFNMHVPANALAAVVLLGIAVTHTRFASSRYWFKARWPLKTGASVLLLGALAFLGGQSFTRAREVLALRRAEKSPEASPVQIAALRQAATLEPNNAETAYDLAERLRAIAWGGRDGYQAVAREAMTWYERGMKLNRWDPYSPMRYGMCLDWLDRHDEALPWYQKAVGLDPNHFSTRGMMAWHYYQVGDYFQAQKWNESSIQMNWTSNPQALLYRDLIHKAMTEEEAKKQAPKP